MPTVIPVASGKGGVGKSVLAANLSLQLVTRGQRVILVDLDWGGSNAHTVLGVMNNHAGIGEFMANKDRALADLIVPLATRGLSLIPGDGLMTAAANIPLIRKQKLIRELGALDADFVVLDLGAGSHLNTVDLFLFSGLGLLVTTPEPTAILNAYTFLKTALFRLLSQSVAAKTDARSKILEFFSGKTSDGGKGLDALITTIRREDPNNGAKLSAARSRLKPRVVLNQAMDNSELQLGARLRQVCEKQLSLAIEYASVVPFDSAVRRSVIDRKPLAFSQPKGPFSTAVAGLADRLVAGGFENEPPFGTYYDLESFAE